MAKKQTRRSISVSRITYERLKAFCEANNISMSQFVESRVGDFLAADATMPLPRPAPRPAPSQLGRPAAPAVPGGGQPSRPAPPVPMTSAAARYAVEPPPPIIKPKTEQPAPPPVAKTADQIFTF